MADNPQAFPPNAGWRDNDPNQRGMTLLDYFAGQALVGLMAMLPQLENLKVKGGGDINEEFLAGQSYAIAAAMLNERQSHEG